MNRPAVAESKRSESAPMAVTANAPDAEGQESGGAQRPYYAIEVDPLDTGENPLLVASYRVLEFALASIALLLALPIMLVEAVLIKLDSPGPVLFVQPRAGRSVIVRGADLVGRRDVIPVSGQFDPDKLYYVPTIFGFIKFRTMYVDARQKFPELYRYHFDNHDQFIAAKYKVEDDPRVTKVGRWLRQLTLDELPNLWSVVTGRASLVGPRPEGPFYLPYYSPEEMKKFTVRSGITGLAQIKGRGNITIGDHLYWDLKYVRERSVLLDIKILVATLWLVLTRRGAF